MQFLFVQIFPTRLYVARTLQDLLTVFTLWFCPTFCSREMSICLEYQYLLLDHHIQQRPSAMDMAFHFVGNWLTIPGMLNSYRIHYNDWAITFSFRFWMIQNRRIIIVTKIRVGYREIWFDFCKRNTILCFPSWWDRLLYPLGLPVSGDTFENLGPSLSNVM